VQPRVRAQEHQVAPKTASLVRRPGRELSRADSGSGLSILVPMRKMGRQGRKGREV